MSDWKQGWGKERVHTNGIDTREVGFGVTIVVIVLVVHQQALAGEGFGWKGGRSFHPATRGRKGLCGSLLLDDLLDLVNPAGQ